MSNSTPRAALPPLPEPFGFLEPTGRSPEFHFLRRPDERGMPVYTAEQVEQIRREAVQACAEIAEAIVTQHWQD